MDEEITPDGYRIVNPPEIKKPDHAVKGSQCGVCGMRFDYGKAYGYSCSVGNCPIFIRVTC